MQAIKNFFYKIKNGKAKHFVCIALLLLFSLGVFGFVAYQELPMASDKSISQMVCDGTDGLTQKITANGAIEQTFVLPENTPLYGVIIRADIGNRVQRGTINCQLMQNGKEIAFASDDLTTLIDGANKGFVFDNMQKNEASQAYTLRITIIPDTQEDEISLYKADKAPEQGFKLIENGKETQGCIALKFLVNHTGDFIYIGFFVIAGFIILSLVCLYVIVFIKKAKAHTVFLVLALSIGIVFCFITPQRSAPDEYVHIAASYANSSVLLGQEPWDENDNLLVRKCDAIKDFGIFRDYSIYAWKETYDGLFQKGDTNTIVPVQARGADVFPLVYAAQTLAITIARLLHLGYIPMLLLGRLFNLLQYTALIYAAIRIMPFAKATMTLAAVLPMSLQLAGSFSYDAYLIGLAFLFVALCFNYAYEKKNVGAKQLVLLCILAALLAPAKAVYILLALLCFIIPSSKITVFKKLSQKRGAILFKGLVVICAMTIWLGYNSSLMQSMVSTVNEPLVTSENNVAQQEQAVTQIQDNVTDALKNDILPNGDSRHYFSLGYILTHIPQTAKMLLNTIQHNSSLYLQGLIGGRLGEIIAVKIEISWIFVISFIMLIMLSVVPTQKEKLPYNGINRGWGFLIAAGIASLIVLACVTWTPINYTKVFGIQGRYFLPILPLVLFGLRSNKLITAQKPLDNGLYFAAAITNALVILNVFSILA